MTTILLGLTWGHSRGFVPLVAASQAYSDAHPDVEVLWEKRSLWAFGEEPLDELAGRYDLLVVDHPFIGHAAKDRLLVPLDDELPPAYLARQGELSVGPSHRSYEADGHQWALAIDASGQTAALRPDLMAAAPQTWDEVIELARSGGPLAMPLRPIDALSAFFSLCAAFGEPAFSHGRGIAPSSAPRALETLRELAAHLDAVCLEMNPIRVLDAMARTDRWAYAPLTYAYSNYSRDGYAPRLLEFAPPPGLRGGTLGGAGLAVSASSVHIPAAVDLARWIASEECQRTAYVLSGGQPGNRAAWEDDVANAITNDFFRRLLPALEAAYLRPTHDGFERIQTRAANIVHGFLSDRAQSAEAALASLETL